MTYTEDFRHILEKEDEVINANLFVFKNSKPSSMKVFPEEVSSVLLTKYFETLSAIMEENEFVPYIPTSIERNTLQVIDTEVLTLWPAMKSARDEIQNVDRVEITVDDYNCTGNTILMDIEFDNGEHVFSLLHIEMLLHGTATMFDLRKDLREDFTKKKERFLH